MKSKFTQIALKLAAFFSIGAAIVACSDYADEFKQDYQAVYGDAKPIEDLNIPFYEFESAYLIWHGFDKTNINATTTSGDMPSLYATVGTIVTFRAKDIYGTNFTTNTLADVGSLVRRSGGIAGVLKNTSGEATAGIIFPFDQSINLSDDSKYTGVALAMGSAYSNASLCLVDANADGSTNSEYCSLIGEKMGKDTALYAVAVPFANLDHVNGESNFNKFMEKANAVLVKFTSKSKSDFGFKIAALGFYNDGSSYLKPSSASKDPQTNTPTSSASNATPVVTSSASVAKSSASVAKSSASVAKSSASVAKSSASATSSLPKAKDFLWTSEDGLQVPSYNWKWQLLGDLDTMWKVPRQFIGSNPSLVLDKIVEVCDGICTEMDHKTGKVELYLPVNVPSIMAPPNTSWKGICLAYSNTANAKLNIVDPVTGLEAHIPLENTKDGYAKADFLWTDFIATDAAMTIANQTAMAITITLTNPFDRSSFFNLFKVGSYGKCGTDPIAIPEYPKFYHFKNDQFFTFHWVSKFCDTCKTQYVDDGLKMWFEDGTFVSQWETSNPTKKQFSVPENLISIKESIEEFGFITTYITKTNNPDMFFKLTEDGSSRDITDWEGLCINYSWSRNIQPEKEIEILPAAYIAIENENGTYKAKIPSDPLMSHNRCFAFNEFLDSKGLTTNLEKVTASKVSIFFEGVDDLVLAKFDLYEIGEYAASAHVNDRYFTDDIVKSCVVDNKSILADGGKATWSLVSSGLHDLSMENVTYDWIMNNDTISTKNTASYISEGVTGFFSVDVTVTLENGMYQNINCPYTKADWPDSFYWNGTTENVNTGYGAKGGIWFPVLDNENGGKSKFYWPTGASSIQESESHCDNSICTAYVLEQGELEYNPYVLIGFDLKGDADNDMVTDTIDATNWNGLCLTYSSDKPIKLKIIPSIATEQAIALNSPYVDLPATIDEDGSFHPKQVDVSWAEFKQGEWDKGIGMTGPEVAAALRTIFIEMANVDKTLGWFNIHEIGSYGQCSSAEYYQSHPIDINYSVNITGDLWQGDSKTSHFDTGKDAGSGTSGYWYSDEYSATYTSWPIQWGDGDTPPLEPVADICEGICGRILSEPNTYPFVGFYIAGEDESHNGIAADVTDWEGVCIVYESELPASLKMDFLSEFSEEIQFDQPNVHLPKTDGIPRIINVPWGQFKQYGFGEKKISGIEGATQLTQLMVQWGSYDSKQEGAFNIKAIGKYNGCSLDITIEQD